MVSETWVIKCAGCGKDLPESYNSTERIPCPDCGSTIRKYFLTLEQRVSVSASVSSVAMDSSGFVTQEERSINCVSGITGRPAKSTISIDRRDPEETKKYHKFEELDEHGIIYETTHEHTDTFPAKRRPIKKE